MPTRRTAPVPAPAAAAGTSAGALGSPDLRQRILATARQLLNGGGVAALSLREVARRAGVTHQAPYHHFGDREAILAELVTQGFDTLADRLAAALPDGLKSDGPKTANVAKKQQLRHQALVASHRAYVGFALDEPGVFRVMFRPDVCDARRFPAVQAAGQRAYGELLRMVDIVHGPGAGEILAHLHWAQVHGLAGLMIDGALGQKLPDRAARDQHLQSLSVLWADRVIGNKAG